ncbi:MAG: hypothetical protein HY703_04660 [Gemmatimonadetes bacterium]|nr:hypothetical protein [Gemmatimonadota bacterium]
MAALPFLSVPDARPESLRASLERFLPAASETDRMRPLARRYARGLLSLRLGHLATAVQQLEALEHSSEVTPADRATAAAFARLLRAELARAQGRPREALEALGEPPLFGQLPHSGLPHHPRAHERWLRAELLRELGREEEALRWYATFPESGEYELAYLAPSHLRRAEVYARTGELRQAALHYARFIGLWRDADAELQPLVRQPERRLARLGGR